MIADDSVLWREGLARLLLEAGVEVSALVGDGGLLVEVVAEHRPDVAVIDVRMPPTFTHEGVEVAEKLRIEFPSMGIVLLSQTLEVRRAAALVRTHPRGFGYLLKDHVLDVATLVDSFTTVAQGGTVLDPDVVGALLGQQPAQNRLARLSPRGARSARARRTGTLERGDREGARAQREDGRDPHRERHDEARPVADS